MHYRPALIHIACWLGVYLVSVGVISEMAGLERAWGRPLYFMVWLASIFYLHLLVVLPKLLGKGKHWGYLVAVGATLCAGVGLGAGLHELFEYIFPPVTDRELELVKFRSAVSVWARQLPPVVLSLALSGLVWNNQLLRKRKEESTELRNRVLEAETKALKNQINPHFLFNTLNNIYSLTQLESKQTGDAVLKLSDILRYVIYDSNHRFVQLSQELIYIKSYFELQLLKDDSIDRVQLHLPAQTGNLTIAPMLLIPFIENSFKHSKFEDTSKGWIETRIALEGNKLVLENRNSVPEKHAQKDEVGGVGLENVRQRLALLYPAKHHLQIDNNGSEFTVRLEIELHEA